MHRNHEPPFVVGKPVTGPYFIDREDEIARLLTLIKGLQRSASSNSVLIGLRRTGKSSILENTAIALQDNKKIVPVMISCDGISSRSLFAKLLADFALESYIKKTGDNSYLKRLQRAISENKRDVLERVSEVKFWELSLRLSSKSADEDSLIVQALQFIDSLAKDKECFFVVMLDEFQDVIKWGDPTLKRIRSAIQSQKNVCYVLAGSATSIMHDLVYQRRSPFYRQFVEIPVKRLDAEMIKSFMKERFASVKIVPGDQQLTELASYCDGYPDYAQRIGLEIFLKVGFGGKISNGLINHAYGDMVQALDGEFANYFVTFSPLEREILISLSTGNKQSSEIAREVRHEPPNISKTLARLVNYGVVEKLLPGRYKLADAVFLDWLRKRFSTSLNL